jgi:ammonia channel protein AmtB
MPATSAFSVNNAAMLVFLMQAGFTMLEAGSVRERNVSRFAFVAALQYASACSGCFHQPPALNVACRSIFKA